MITINQDKKIQILRGSVLALLNAECDKRMAALVADYPEHEQKTFTKQEAEARTYLADSMSATPLIDELAAYRGIAKADLAARILGKADSFAVNSGRIVGHRQKLEDQLAAADKIEDIEEIDPLVGWPV